MSEVVKTVALPEWAWLNGGDHEKGGDPLHGRNVVYHVRSASVFEFFESKKFVAEKGIVCADFEYKNIAGVVEHHVCALHYSAGIDDPEVLKVIMQKAIVWYKNWMSWEDRNIANNEFNMLN